MDLLLCARAVAFHPHFQYFFSPDVSDSIFKVGLFSVLASLRHCHFRLVALLPAKNIVLCDLTRFSPQFDRIFFREALNPIFS